MEVLLVSGKKRLVNVWRSDQLNVLMKTNIIPVSQWRGGCVKKELMKIKNVNV